MVYSRAQSLVGEQPAEEHSSYHQHTRSLSPGTTPTYGVRTPSYAVDPNTPSLTFLGRESDLPALSSTSYGSKELRDSDHSHLPVRGTSSGRLRDLRCTEQSEPLCEKGERAGRGGSRITPPTLPSEQKRLGHRRQRTGVMSGMTKDLIASIEHTSPQPKQIGLRRSISRSLVQTRVASFENLKLEPRAQLNRSSAAPAALPSQKPATLDPPIRFSPQTASRRYWDNPSLREMAHMQTAWLQEDGLDLDLELRQEELITPQPQPLPKPRQRRQHMPTQSLPDNTISRAASVMYEPEQVLSHNRSQSVPKVSQTVSRSQIPPRLVPANTCANMFPSAFRVIPADAEERPTSSGSDTSTISSTGPATPTSTTSAGSWLTWFWSSSPKASPASEKHIDLPKAIALTSHGALSSLQAEADEFGIVQQKSIGDHWADTGDLSTAAAPVLRRDVRTISRKVRWEDEESVRFSWF